MKKILTNLAHFAFPNRCLFCHDETEFHFNDYPLLCSDCLKLFRPLNSADLERYHKTYLETFYERSIIAYQFDELSQKLLHFVKYHRGIQLAQFMGLLIYHTQEHHFSLDYDAVLPCPLHPRKFREREFNQAEEISKGLAEQLHISVDTESLIRNRYTKSQTQFNKLDRMKNLQNAFTFKNDQKYKHLLIVDDVITTGSTLNTIAETIKSVNPKIELTAVSFASPI